MIFRKHKYMIKASALLYKPRALRKFGAYSNSFIVLEEEVEIDFDFCLFQVHMLVNDRFGSNNSVF